MQTLLCMIGAASPNVPAYQVLYSEEVMLHIGKYERMGGRIGMVEAVVVVRVRYDGKVVAWSGRYDGEHIDPPNWCLTSTDRQWMCPWRIG